VGDERRVDQRRLDQLFEHGLRDLEVCAGGRNLSAELHGAVSSL